MIEIMDHNNFAHKFDFKMKFKKIEECYDITIIYSVVLGSMCWGYNNIYSDCDVKFIYVYNNYNSNDLKHYNKDISILFSDDNIDFEGWELGKFLNAHYQYDFNAFEMLNYGIILRNLNLLNYLPCFNKKVLRNRYKSAFKNHYNRYIKQKNIDNWKGLKKLIITLRYACNYISLSNNQYPPQNIIQLILSYGDVSFINCIDDYRSCIINEDYNNIVNWLEGMLSYNTHTTFTNKKHDFNDYVELFNMIIEEYSKFE